MELKSISWRSSMRSCSRYGDNNSKSMQEFEIEHGLGLPCGVFPEYNDISSDGILTGEFDESSKFSGAMFSLRWMPRADGDMLELMFNAFVMRLQFLREKDVVLKTGNQFLYMLRLKQINDE